MKKMITRLSALPAVIAFMVLCMSMTTPIESSSIKNESNVASSDFSIFMVDESWTWSDFAGAAVVGGVSGAAGGAVAGIVGTCCPAGAGAGALAGGAGGVVAGAVAYAGTQAWNYFFGSSSTAQQVAYSYSEAALD